MASAVIENEGEMLNEAGLVSENETASDNVVTSQLKQYSFATECNSQIDLEIYLKTRKHRTICTHGKQKRTCTILHDDFQEEHEMVVCYYQCSSIFCFDSIDDKCEFRYRVNACLFDNKIRVYQVNKKEI
jgi:hypothetical protein